MIIEYTYWGQKNICIFYKHVWIKFKLLKKKKKWNPSRCGFRQKSDRVIFWPVIDLIGVSESNGLLQHFFRFGMLPDVDSSEFDDRRNVFRIRYKLQW